MCKLAGFALSALCLLLCVPSASPAVEVVPLPPQMPARTPSGSTNLTDVWLHNGGGRLYWNTLVAPRQVNMEGARFNDPAAVPELATTPPPAKKVTVRRASHKSKVSKKSPQASAVAPKDVGKTALKKADVPARGSAIPPLGGGVPQSAAPAVGGMPGGAAPYSSLAPSIGGVDAGAAQTGAGQATPPLPAVPSPSSFNAEDVLPRANARP